MADHSAIEWTDATWSPVTGCTKVSAGCANCYAERMHKRFSDEPFSKVTLHPDRLDIPLHWRKPRRIFVCSMSDLFHPDVPDRFIAQVFAVMLCAPEHTYQVLTKRPERMRDFMQSYVEGGAFIGRGMIDAGIDGIVHRLVVAQQMKISEIPCLDTRSRLRTRYRSSDSPRRVVSRDRTV